MRATTRTSAFLPGGFTHAFMTNSALSVQGIDVFIEGAGPRTVLESHAKRADERLDLEDLRRATKVVARSLCELLG